LGKFGQSRKKLEARVRRRLLYGARARLVTEWSTEGSPAREEGEHAVVLAFMHGGKDEDELLLDILGEGVRAGAGLRFGPSWWTPAGPVAGLLRSGKVQVRCFSPLFLFCFYFLFSNFISCFVDLNST
jgi:hypothetical protein